MMWSCKSYKNIKTFFKQLKSIKIRWLHQKTQLGEGYVPHLLKPTGDDYFGKPTSSEEPFTLVLPPPNITGTLHLGHALTATIQDVLVRWHRMNGRQTLWIPGLDHAGIATQVVVEKKLWNERKVTRHDLGREQFEKEVWKWREDNGQVINEQLKRLDLLLDWDKEVFTLDSVRSVAVNAAFVKLFEKGLIYRGDHLVNWSCVLQSAISDIEVEHVEVDGPTNLEVPGYEKPVQFGVLTHFAYKFYEAEDEIIVATTRPETMIGDVAVAVNPKDNRFSQHIGRFLWHPFRQTTIPVIADDFVDPNFGTGAVKITPAHNRDDYNVAKRNNLDVLQIFDENGKITKHFGQFSALKRFDARTVILDELQKAGMLRANQNHKMVVPVCSRSKDVIELLLRPQWFVRCSDMAKKATEDVQLGRLMIESKQFEKIWFYWLENIRDWCISRQLWWGHRIPAYFCKESESGHTKWIAAQSLSEAQEKASQHFNTNSNILITQDEDVLDTWFSSALQPFSAFGWPENTVDLNKHYPISLMETGHDILFFWVARMVMLGTELTDKLPFNKVLLHGIICDSQGRKMSKSLGNVIRPEEIIEGRSLEHLESDLQASHKAGLISQKEFKLAVKNQKKLFPKGIPECGSDALRYTLLSHNIQSHYINFDIMECHTNKLFGNKIWQATKFALLWYQQLKPNLQDVQVEELLPFDLWILSRLTELVESASQNFQDSNFHFVTSALKNFLYYEFCDIYLETTKRELRLKSKQSAGHCFTLLTCLDEGLRILSPFMPRLSQHLHKHLPLDWKTNKLKFERNKQLENEIQHVNNLVTTIRRLKKTFNVTAKHDVMGYVATQTAHFNKFSNPIKDLTGIQNINIVSEVPNNIINRAVKDRYDTTEIYLCIPEDLKQNLQMDLPKLEKKRIKLQIELEKINKIVSGHAYNVKTPEETRQLHLEKIASIESQLSRIDYINQLLR